ncbi:unnamed protein product [Amoebophrya sp. A25]|nr:unnamed protein product [Amoebophrya sp. A25]|eukprot:GSA25T00000850001.1
MAAEVDRKLARIEIPGAFSDDVPTSPGVQNQGKSTATRTTSISNYNKSTNKLDGASPGSASPTRTDLGQNKSWRQQENEKHGTGASAAAGRKETLPPKGKDGLRKQKEVFQAGDAEGRHATSKVRTTRSRSPESFAVAREVGGPGGAAPSTGKASTTSPKKKGSGPTVVTSSLGTGAAVASTGERDRNLNQEQGLSLAGTPKFGGSSASNTRENSKRNNSIDGPMPPPVPIHPPGKPDVATLSHPHGEEESDKVPRYWNSEGEVFPMQRFNDFAEPYNEKIIEMEKAYKRGDYEPFKDDYVAATNAKTAERHNHPPENQYNTPDPGEERVQKVVDKRIAAAAGSKDSAGKESSTASAGGGNNRMSRPGSGHSDPDINAEILGGGDLLKFRSDGFKASNEAEAAGAAASANSTLTDYSGFAVGEAQMHRTYDSNLGTDGGGMPEPPPGGEMSEEHSDHASAGGNAAVPNPVVRDLPGCYFEYDPSGASVYQFDVNGTVVAVLTDAQYREFYYGQNYMAPIDEGEEEEEETEQHQEGAHNMLAEGSHCRSAVSSRGFGGSSTNPLVTHGTAAAAISHSPKRGTIYYGEASPSAKAHYNNRTTSFTTGNKRNYINSKIVSGPTTSCSSRSPNSRIKTAVKTPLPVSQGDVLEYDPDQLRHFCRAKLLEGAGALNYVFERRRNWEDEARGGRAAILDQHEAKLVATAAERVDQELEEKYPEFALERRLLNDAAPNEPFAPGKKGMSLDAREVEASKQGSLPGVKNDHALRNLFLKPNALVVPTTIDARPEGFSPKGHKSDNVDSYASSPKNEQRSRNMDLNNKNKKNMKQANNYGTVDGHGHASMHTSYTEKQFVSLQRPALAVQDKAARQERKKSEFLGPKAERFEKAIRKITGHSVRDLVEKAAKKHGIICAAAGQIEESEMALKAGDRVGLMASKENQGLYLPEKQAQMEKINEFYEKKWTLVMDRIDKDLLLEEEEYRRNREFAILHGQDRNTSGSNWQKPRMQKKTATLGDSGEQQGNVEDEENAEKGAANKDGSGDVGTEPQHQRREQPSAEAGGDGDTTPGLASKSVRLSVLDATSADQAAAAAAEGGVVEGEYDPISALKSEALSSPTADKPRQAEFQEEEKRKRAEPLRDGTLRLMTGIRMPGHESPIGYRYRDRDYDPPGAFSDAHSPAALARRRGDATSPTVSDICNLTTGGGAPMTRLFPTIQQPQGLRVKDWMADYEDNKLARMGNYPKLRGHDESRYYRGPYGLSMTKESREICHEKTRQREQEMRDTLHCDRMGGWHVNKGVPNASFDKSVQPLYVFQADEDEVLGGMAKLAKRDRDQRCNTTLSTSRNTNTLPTGGGKEDWKVTSPETARSNRQGKNNITGAAAEHLQKSPLHGNTTSCPLPFQIGAEGQSSLVNDLTSTSSLNRTTLERLPDTTTVTSEMDVLSPGGAGAAPVELLGELEVEGLCKQEGLSSSSAASSSTSPFRATRELHLQAASSGMKSPGGVDSKSARSSSPKSPSSKKDPAWSIRDQIAGLKKSLKGVARFR